MMIDKGKLIALLAERTNQSKQAIEEQLDELKDNVCSAAQSGSEFYIEGFGTFKAEKGALEFEPTEQLETEINQKYAGMKPIELMEAFKNTGAGVPVEPKITPKEPEVEQEEPRQVPPQEQPKPKQAEPDEPEVEPVIESEQQGETQETLPAEPKKKTESKPPAERKKYKRTPAFADRDNDGWRTIFVAAVIVIAILIGGFIMYDTGVFSASNSGFEPADTTGVSAVLPSSPAIGDSDAPDNAADSLEQNGPATVSGNSTGGQESASSPYGLMGTVNEEAQNGYTIVIHSFRLRSTVRGIADSLSQQGYRTVMFNIETGGQSRWRLGLGQFETIADAQQAVPQLSERDQNNHFIKRIQ